MIRLVTYLFLILLLLTSCRASHETTSTQQQAEFHDSSVISIAAMERIQELLHEDRSTEDSLVVDFAVAMPSDSLRPLPIVVKGKAIHKRTTQQVIQANRIRKDSLQATEATQRHDKDYHSEATEDFKSSGSAWWWKMAFFIILTLMIYDTLWRR